MNASCIQFDCQDGIAKAQTRLGLLVKKLRKDARYMHHEQFFRGVTASSLQSFVATFGADF